MACYTGWLNVGQFSQRHGAELPAPLTQYIYDNLNETQSWKCHVGVDPLFNEVKFFYCSKDSDEIDSLVVHNPTGLFCQHAAAYCLVGKRRLPAPSSRLGRWLHPMSMRSASMTARLTRRPR